MDPWDHDSKASTGDAGAKTQQGLRIILSGQSWDAGRYWLVPSVIDFTRSFPLNEAHWRGGTLSVRRPFLLSRCFVPTWRTLANLRYTAAFCQGF